MQTMNKGRQDRMSRRLQPAARSPMTWLLVAGYASIAAGGCSGRPYAIAPVAGVVMLDGQPLEGALVNTQPIAQGSSIAPGPGSFGRTDADGRYALELVTVAEAGAVVGTHRVTIRIPQKLSKSDRPDSYDRSHNQLPTEARDGSLRLAVPAEGISDADFSLTSRPQRGR